MKTLLKILNWIFVALGIIFLILIIMVGYFIIADPFNLKAMLPTGVSPISIIKTATGNNEIKIDNIDKNPLLTEEQEAQLEAIGVDPANLPSEITPEIEKCLVEKLGETRASQITQGDSPNTADFLKASACFN